MSDYYDRKNKQRWETTRLAAYLVLSFFVGYGFSEFVLWLMW